MVQVPAMFIVRTSMHYFIKAEVDCNGLACACGQGGPGYLLETAGKKRAVGHRSMPA